MKRDVPYPEYAPFYWITDDGRVISKETGLDIKPFNKHHGYQKVKLRANGVQKNATVARLVALAFIPTDDTSKDVDHIDNDKLNNHVSNLQWLTRRENVAKSFKQGRVNARKGKLSGKLTGLYLSHRAVELLGTVDNKSKFVSKLIEDNFGATPTNPADVKHIPDVTVLEQECCKNDIHPCKHWNFDGTRGGYINTLSGRFEEAE